MIVISRGLLSQLSSLSSVAKHLTLGLVAVLLSSCGRDAGSNAAALSGPAPNKTETAASITGAPTPWVPSHEEWRKAITAVPLPKTGCFQASHPGMTWTEVPCAPPRDAPPLGPAKWTHGAITDTVGGGGMGDYSMAVTSGSISTVEGLFTTVSGVTSGGSYSLQMNTNPFSPTNQCGGAMTPKCKGWQQFVYISAGYIQMQYWLLNYGPSCNTAKGWNSYGTADCYKLGPEVSAPYVAPKNLAGVTLTANAVVTGYTTGTDTMYFYDGSGTIQAQAQDSVLGLALSGNWTGAEYNIFGEGGAGLYTFNPNVTLVGRINVSNGRRASPLCANKSYTGETNSLTAIGGGCCPVGGTASTLPAIVFEESNIAGIGAPFCLLTEWPSLPEL